MESAAPGRLLISKKNLLLTDGQTEKLYSKYSGVLTLLKSQDALSPLSSPS